MVGIYYILFILMFGGSAAALAVVSARDRKLMNVMPLILSAIIAATVFLLFYPTSGTTYQLLILAMGFAVMACILALLYKSRPYSFFVVALFIAYGALISYTNIKLDIGMFGIGLIVGSLYRDRYIARQREDRSMRKTKTEIDRDLIQICIGIVVFAIFLLTTNYIYILFPIMILSYCIINAIAAFGGGAYRTTAHFERSGVEFGRGAIHLLAGAAILLGFANQGVAIVGLGALLLADPIATIVGISFYRSRRIPHNKRKSYAGSIAFFMVTAILGVIFLGIVGLLMAIVLTIVESFDLPIDDNIAVPIAAVLLGLLI